MDSRTSALLVAAVVALRPVDARSAPVTTTTPNIDSPEVTRSGTADFVFSHRFDVIGEKVFNSPTFTLDVGFLDRFSLGVRYATSSDVGTGPNELEPILKMQILKQATSPLDLTAEAAYNTAANSVDGAVVVARRIAFATLLATVRGFSALYSTGGAGVAAGAGATLEVTRYLYLLGDVNRVLTAADTASLAPGWDRLGWSGGIAFQIPYTPHSLSIYATNVNTQTLEGSSRGTDRIRYGFAFDVPLEGFGRWLAIFNPPPESGPAAAPATGAAPAAAAPSGEARVVEVTIEGFAYSPAELVIRPGDTVRWTNRDTVPHTVTESSDAWTSPILQQGGTYQRRFDTAGRVDYYCTVHPFMKAAVEVGP